MVPQLGGDGRSCAEHVGQLNHTGKSPCTKAPAPSGADRQGHCLVKYLGASELWITRTFALMNKVRKEHCCHGVSQLNTQIQGLHPGVVHCLSTEAAQEVIN